MPGALKAKGIWRQDVCNGTGENIPGKEKEYLNANTQKGFYLECLFRLTRRRESLKQLAFFTGWHATALKWFFTEEETEYARGGGGGGRVDEDYVNIALDQSILGGKLFRFPTQTAG